MRKKGRAHPDRVEATQTHQTLRKTLQEIEAAMNASDPEKARALLLGIADHLTTATGKARETLLEGINTAPPEMLSRDAWIAAAKTLTPWPAWLQQAQERDPDLVLEPKMTWRALFGASSEKVDAYIDALAREAMGDALGVIGQRLVKTIEVDDATSFPVVRLDLDALEDVAKTVKSRYVGFVLPPAAREGLDGEPIDQGNPDCVDRGAMPCVPRTMLKNAVAHLRATAKDPCAWVDAKIVWTVTRREMMRLPGGPQLSRLVHVREQALDEAGEYAECQELLLSKSELDPSFIATSETPDKYVRVPVYGPPQRLPQQLRADLVLRWIVLRDDGRQRDGYIRCAGQYLTPADMVDIVHTTPVTFARSARKEAA